MEEEEEEQEDREETGPGNPSASTRHIQTGTANVLVWGEGEQFD